MAGPQRHSRQREVILQELRKLHTHPTAADLYQIVRRRLPRISLGTVYRNLDQLAEIGQVRRLYGKGGQARFDGDVSPHLHVRCVHCGRVADVHGARVPEPVGEPRSPDGFEILGCQIEFAGMCPDCTRLQKQL